jgi:hypothetical protein
MFIVVDVGTGFYKYKVRGRELFTTALKDENCIFLNFAITFFEGIFSTDWKSASNSRYFVPDTGF